MKTSLEIKFVKNKRCSWHYHKIKDEVFYIQSRKSMVIYSKDGDLIYRVGK